MRGLNKDSTVIKNEVEKLRAILNSSPDIYLLIDREYKIVAYNKQATYNAKFLFGKHLHQGMEVSEFYLENAYERFALDLKKVFSGELVVRDEELHFANNIQWFQFRFFPIYNNEKEIIATGFHAIDISDFKKNKEALHNERKLFDQGPAVAFKWLPFKEKSVTKFVSGNVKSVFGYTDDDLIGKPFLDYIHKDDVSRIAEQIETQVALELRKENDFVDSAYRVKCANGEYKWVSDYSFLAVESSGEKVVYGYLVDITVQKKTTQELEQKNKQLNEALEIANTQAKILEITTNMIMFTDVEGNITWVNEAFATNTGYTLAEVFGKKSTELFIREETSADAVSIISEAIQKRTKASVELINYKKNGEKFWVELNTEPIYDEADNLSAFLSILNDITERKTIEEKLNDRNEQLKKFSFTTSHELRHEFAKILSLLENKDILIESGSELDILDEINTATKTMNTIISKMNEQLYISDTQKTKEIEQLALTDVDEICLVDDDDIVCFINKKIISSVLPDKRIEVFNYVDEAINYIKSKPSTFKRYIFLDLNMPLKNGWQFLEEYKALANLSPVIILTSSIDTTDRQRATNYPEVISFLSKPLTHEKLDSFL